MSDSASITNILLAVSGGALAVAVSLLIGMSKKLNRIELKVERLIVKDEHRDKEIEQLKKTTIL